LWQRVFAFGEKYWQQPQHFSGSKAKAAPQQEEATKCKRKDEKYHPKISQHLRGTMSGKTVIILREFTKIQMSLASETARKI